MRKLVSRGRAATLNAIFLIWTIPGFITAQEPAHPILPISGSGSGADAVISGWTEQQYIDSFVPRSAPRHWDYGYGPAVVPGDSSWSWSKSDPNRIKSNPSGTMFPNATYPIQYQSIGVLSGKTIQAPYYIRAGSSTAKSMPLAHIDYSKRAQLRTDMIQLAQKYMASGSSHATRNQTYARRIAVALDDWAKYTPDYFMTEKNSASFISVTPSYVLSADKQRASDHNGLAHEWGDNEVLAFDVIFDSPALAQLSIEKGYDVRQHIMNGYFFDIGDYFKNRIPYNVATSTNLSGPFRTLAKVAQVTNRPDYTIWLDGYLDQTVGRNIRRDGTNGEGISYSVGYINTNRDVAIEVDDYFDVRPADTPALVAARDNVQGYVDILTYGQQQWHTVRMPNGELPPFGDTTFGSSNTRNAGNSALLPAYGHASMGAGSGAQSIQVNQNFADDQNHQRADVTGFSLWALGAELLGNIRYHNGTPGRQFTEQILAYNAVTVDRSNMSRGAWTYGASGHLFTSGDITLYEPDKDGLAVTEIDGHRPYRNKTSRYQRIMLMNSQDLNAPYVVDVFRVTGGRTHDYLLHGSVRFDSTGESSVPLAAMSGTYPMLEGSETWNPPTSSGSSFAYYGLFRNMSSAAASGNFQITYRDASRTSLRDLRLWMTDPGANTTIYQGRTPVPSRTNDEPDDFFEKNLWRPSTIVRRRIASGTLDSLFVSVVEPMKGGVSAIQNVERLPVSGGGSEAVALRVTFTSGRVDTYLINVANADVAGSPAAAPSISTADGQFALNGRIGLRSTSSTGNKTITVAASNFTFPGGSHAPGTQFYSGTVSGAVRTETGGAGNALITSTPLPVGTELEGRWMSVLFGTYDVINSSSLQTGISEMFEIDHVEQVGAQYYIHMKTDHQLTVTGSAATELFSPKRTFSGPTRFEIALSASDAPPSIWPEPWESQDVGSVALAGSAAYAGNTFTLNAGGSDIWGTADQFHFVHQGANGDVTITARVDSVESTNGWAKAGVMIRQSTAANSAHVAIYVTPSNGVSIQYRGSNGSSTTDYARSSGKTAPYWVRLERVGNLFKGYYSADGNTWTQLVNTGNTPINVAMSGNVESGLALTSHNTSSLNTSTFSNVSVVGEQSAAWGEWLLMQ